MAAYLCKGVVHCYPGIPVGLLLAVGVGVPLLFIAYGYARGRITDNA